MQRRIRAERQARLDNFLLPVTLLQGKSSVFFPYGIDGFNSFRIQERQDLNFPGYNGFGGDLLKECKSCAFAFFSRCHALCGNEGIKIILWLHELNDV